MVQLNPFAEIIGVGAASGLYFQDDIIYLIGDNSAYLYKYYVKEKSVEKTQVLYHVVGDKLDNILKANKPDFESICFYDNRLFIIGSGSTMNRNTLLIYSLETKEVVEKDLSSLFERLREVSYVDADNFNIEGAVFTDFEWLLFNRGNGALNKNGVFRISDIDFNVDAVISYTPIDVPKINNIISSFTDAVVVGNEVFFLATAENTTSTYEDGEVVGSLIGSLNLKTLELNFTERISETHKFEGLTVYKNTPTEIEFLLCEDKDNEELVSTVYKLSLER